MGREEGKKVKTSEDEKVRTADGENLFLSLLPSSVLTVSFSFWLFLLLLSVAHASFAARPYHDNRSREPNYAGPGREQEEPPDVSEVLIGYFGPAIDFGLRTSDRRLDEPNLAGTSGFEFRNSDFEFSAGMWCAACLAVEQANGAGGHEGLPFRLVPAWSDDPWGSGVRKLTRLAFADRVWAVIGGVDGPTTHLAEQVAVKAGVPLLNPVSTDKTVNLINVPWVFSCTPQDCIQARALAAALLSKPGRDSFILASAVDHDSHLFARELQKCLTAEQVAFAYHYQFRPDGRDVNDLVQRICGSGTDAAVVIAGARPSARLLLALRRSGYTGNVYGGPWMGQQAFVAAAGRLADGVVFPCSYVPSAELAAFEERFAQRFGRRPDYLAAHTYDAVNLLVAAIRRTGLNRARIRDTIRELSPCPGVSGPIIWDPPGGNCRPVHVCTIKNGQVIPLARNREGRPTRTAEDPQVAGIPLTEPNLRDSVID